eukprot:6298060-Pyramimonas_sp.AAC.1
MTPSTAPAGRGSCKNARKNSSFMPFLQAPATQTASVRTAAIRICALQLYPSVSVTTSIAAD